jgi:O-antigen biosynthesis protein
MYAKSIGKKEKDFLQSEFESFEHFTQYGMIPNRGDLFEEALMKLRPTVVMFDRFLAEEAFSFRVRAVCPEALRVLDMQDVHALRRERERIVTSSSSSSSSRNTIVDSINAKPCAMDGDFSREISAIYRSDLTFVCSQVEMEILQNVCGIDREKLVLAPFFETIDEKRGHCEETIVPFKKRKDFFVSIGTFNHAPNVDGLRYLKNDIWPLIRKKLGTGVQFHAYGASCLPKHMDELNDEKNGFFIKGFCEDISTTLGEAKILLAPLRFGAGIKGKVIEAFKYGTPVITTPIGSEGIGVPSKYSDNSYSEYKWGGTFDCVTPEAFANAAVESFTNEALWTEQSMRAFELRKTLFDKEKTIPPILDAIEKKRENLDAVRKEDFIGQAFWHQSNRSTDFFSRWIELKETGANTGSSLS